MDRRWIFAVILGTFPAAASAQQSHLDMRRQIEQLAAIFSERYNKQDAGALANLFTKDAVRVTSGNSAPSVGPQAIEKTFKTQFESGFRHIELEIDQVSPFGTDAAITLGRYEITGRGQNGPLKVDGRWTEVEVREGGVWKIRHSTVVPKIEPNPIIPRVEPNSITPRTEGDSVRARIAANSIIPRMEANSITPRMEVNSITPRIEANPVTSGIEASPIAPRLDAKQVRPAPTTEATAPRDAGEPIMAIVSIKSQQVTFYDAEDWILRAPVSTGTAGRETPAGIFAVIEKDKDHHSSLYDDAWMPNMQRITWNGVALHGGPLPGHAASHGCKPIGTHVFTAMARNDAGLRWTAVAIDNRDDAKDALDRITAGCARSHRADCIAAILDHHLGRAAEPRDQLSHRVRRGAQQPTPGRLLDAPAYGRCPGCEPQPLGQRRLRRLFSAQLELPTCLYASARRPILSTDATALVVRGTTRVGRTVDRSSRASENRRTRVWRFVLDRQPAKPAIG